MKLEFSQSVKEQLKYYVYALKDPRSLSKIDFFYVGKGIGNRVFNHLEDAKKNHTQTRKLETINEIYTRGEEPEIVIICHSLTEDQAFIVESVLISLIGVSNITNKVSGHYSKFNLFSPKELELEYGVEPALLDRPCILIKVNRLYQEYCESHNVRTLPNTKLYEITRSAWKVGSRREKYKYVASVAFGLIREVYEVEEWVEATVGSKGDDLKGSGRWAFNGQVTLDQNMRELVGKSVDHLFSSGAQNPIKYFN